MGKNSDFTLAKAIVKRLQNAGYTAFFAGGVVRDMLLKRSTINDIDIATSATPEIIKGLFKNVHAVGESFGVMLIVSEGVPFEVATFREDGGYQNGRHPESVLFSSPEKDSQRRDFTINGMFYDPLSDRVHDFVGGKKDLDKGILRTIGKPEERFGEDYLRMLRAIRFSARFDFPIEEDTWSALLKLASQIKEISVERIFQEVTKMITGPRPAKALRMLLDSGLLREVLPEVVALVGCEQPPEYHPEGDVFEHTLGLFEHLESDEPMSESLAWGALLHDIGKPDTMTMSDRIRFNNHHKVGSTIAKEILERLKVSNDLKESVVTMVGYHMQFVDVTHMKKSTLKKMLARPTIEDELRLHCADCLASNGSLANYEYLLSKQKEFKDVGVAPKAFLNGGDLIKKGVKPSPYFGEILQEAYELQLEDELKGREEALQWLNNRLDIEQNT